MNDAPSQDHFGHANRVMFSALLKRFARPAAVYLVVGALSRVGFILLIPLYSRRLDKAEYGDYVLAQTALSVAPAFVLGLPAAISLFYFDTPDRAESKKRVGAVAKLMLLVTLVVGLLAQTAILLVVPAAATGLFARWSLTCIVVASAGSVLAIVPVQFFRDAQRPIPASLFQLAEFLLVLGTGILFVSTLGRGLKGSLEGLAVTYATLGVVSTVFIYGYLGGDLSRSITTKAVRFSAPYVAHFLATWVQGVADRWTMKLAGLGVTLGPYSLANQLSTPSAMVVTAWNLERSARIGELYREGGLREIRRNIRGIVQTYVIASVVPSLLVVVAIPLMKFFINKNFYGALVYLPALLIVTCVDAFYYPSFHVVYWASRSRWISTVTTISAIASIAFSALLVSLFGVWGALLARAAASFVRSASLGFAARRCFVLNDEEIQARPEPHA